jgi:ribonuclease HI
MNTHSSSIIFTDGASSGNPGPGGWGAIILVSNTKGVFGSESRVIELGGGEARTTNNRMELSGAIGALSYMQSAAGNKDAGVGAVSEIILFTDSSYLRNGIMQWVPVWQKRGWTTTAKTSVLNQELWQELAQLTDTFTKKSISISWRLIKGHNGFAGNERVDEIATGYAAGGSSKKSQATLYNGSLEKYQIELGAIETILALPDSPADYSDADRRRSSERHSGKKPYSYVSVVGRKVMIHPSWFECEQRVKGVSGARFKKVFSAEEEKRVIADFKNL